MDNLIPHFIHEQFTQGRRGGAFAAATLFVDIAGFTRLTENLMQHAKDGAECLTDALRSIFEPLVHLVSVHGGLIPRFAGDAFTAIFPLDSPTLQGEWVGGEIAALQAAFAIQQFFGPAGRLISTPYGDFTLSVKVGFALGTVHWGIPGQAGIYDFYFRGPAIDDCAHAEEQAEKGQIIVEHKALPFIQTHVTSQPLAHPHYHQLLACSLPALQAEVAPNLQPSSPCAPLRPLTVADLAPFVPPSILDLPGRAEFREICVLFLSFCEPSHDAPAVGEPTAEESLHTFLAEAMTTIRIYGGNFNQIDFGDQGGLLVLLFGAPVAYENNCVRAAEYLLAMQAKALPIRWRASLTFGTVWAGMRGGVERCEYGAVGDVMNMASRMAMKATWGEIWLSQAVADQLQGAYQVTALGTMPFKGKSQPQPIYRLLTKTEASQPALALGNLVGRADTLARLLAWVQPIYAGRCAGLLSIYGEAGIGKSRLVHELQKQMTAMTEEQRAGTRPVLWLKCPVDAMLRQSLNPFKTLLRHYFHQRSDQSATQNRAHFDQGIDRLIQRLRELTPGLPVTSTATQIRMRQQTLERSRSFLAALAGIQWPGSLYEQVEPQLRFENMLAAFKNFVQAEAACQPVLLELEDIHWLDEDSQRLLQLLTHNLADTALAILCTARYGDDGAPCQLTVAADLPQQQLDLDYLTLDGVKTYAEALLHYPIDEEAAHLLLEKTNGNPFFVEQLVLDLREHQLFTLSTSDTGVRYGIKAFDSTTVPTTLNGLLVARLDRLGAATKRVVQTAAVLGREFAQPVLAQMVSEPQVLPAKLKQAEQEQIWSPVATTRYLFRHALLRDAAYDMQLRAHLRALHRQAGVAIQQVYSPELSLYYPALAFHYDQAAAAAEAAHWYSLAGEEAAARYANEEAVRYFTRALACTPENDLATRYRCLLGREQVYEVQSKRAAQQESLLLLWEVAQQLAEPEKLAEVSLRQATFARLTSDYPAALVAAQQAVAYAQQAASAALLLKGYQVWGRTLWHQGHYGAAQAQLQNALALAHSTQQRGDEALCRYDIGVTFYYEGAYAQARQQLAQAQAIYRHLADRRGESSTLIMFGNIARELGDYGGAQQQYEAALQLCQALGWRYGELFLLGSIGNNAFELGDYAAAQRYHQQAILGYAEVGNRNNEALSLATLGLISHILGDQATAKALVEQALAMQQTIGDKNGESYSCTYLGHSLTALGDWPGALAAYQQAIALRQALKVGGQRLDSLAGLAHVLWLLGEQTQAQQHVATITAWLEEQGVDGVELPIRVYLTCYHILEATAQQGVNQLRYAQQILAAGYCLLQQRANAIQDEVMCQRFLQNVPFNRELLANWQAQNPKSLFEYSEMRSDLNPGASFNAG